MPYGDGTGPMGQGPRTGRGMGPCGARMRAGWGYGAGFGPGFRRFISPKNELVALEEEQNMLEEDLRAIKEEIAALKGKGK